MAMAFGLAIVWWDLVGVVDGDSSVEEEEGEKKGFRKWRWSSCRSSLKKMFPVTSIKIVVVVWQILTQVSVELGQEQRSRPSQRGLSNFNINTNVLDFELTTRLFQPCNTYEIYGSFP